MPAAEAVGVEGGAGHVRHPGGDRARAAWPASPGRAAGSPRRRSRPPARSSERAGRHVVGQPGDHRVAALPVHLAEHLDLARASRGSAGRPRRRTGRTPAGTGSPTPGPAPASPGPRAAPAPSRPGNPGRRSWRTSPGRPPGPRPASASPGSVRRRSRADRTGCPRPPAVGRLGDRQDLGPPLQRLGDAGRVLEVRDGVEELDPLAGPRQRGDRLAEGDRVPGRARPSRRARPRTGRTGTPPARRRSWAPRTSTTSPGSQKMPGDQVQALLRADGDGDVVGVGARCPRASSPRRWPRGWSARPGRSRTAWPGDRRSSTSWSERRADHVQRQVGDVGHAAGQRDHLGSVGHREQGADGRGGHPVGPGRVPVDVVVQPGVAAAQSLQSRVAMTQRRRRLTHQTRVPHPLRARTSQPLGHRPGRARCPLVRFRRPTYHDCMAQSSKVGPARPVRWPRWLALGVFCGLALGFALGLAKPRIRS